MNKAVQTTDIRGELIVLGTGTSVGVPAIGCGCDVCRSDQPKNQRTRCAVILGLPEGNLLIDTPPDLRAQLLREEIGIVHAVLYTHEHADHVMGLDDLRLMQFYLGSAVPLYCQSHVEERIRKSFDYAFDVGNETHAGAVPKIEFVTIDQQPFTVLGAAVTPIRLMHGPQFEVFGFRVGNVAYCTDTNGIPPESAQRLQGLDVLILDALRYAPHVTHFGLEQAVEAAQALGAQRTFFTHICHDLDHDTVNGELPETMELAFDGLRIPLS